MKKTKFVVLGAIGLTVAMGLSSLATIANERWDGVSICVNHKNRNITAASGDTCPGGSTLRVLGLDPIEIETLDAESATQILSGQGAPSLEIGNLGDFYIDLQTANLYGSKTETSWGDAVRLRGRDGSSGGGSTGPQGPAGPTGATGATGPQGPAGADGADGADGTDADSRGAYFIEKTSRVLLNSSEGTSQDGDDGEVATEVFNESGFAPGKYLYTVSVEVQRANNGGNGPLQTGKCYIDPYAAEDTNDQENYWGESIGKTVHYSFSGFVEFSTEDPDFVLKCISYQYSSLLREDGPYHASNFDDGDNAVGVRVSAVLAPVSDVTEVVVSAEPSDDPSEPSVGA